MTQPIKAVVLAAGKGTRLRTEGVDLPKVMRLAAGRPLLDYVTQALDFLPREDVILVVGYQREAVLKAYPGYPHAIQAQQLGTGHAVQSAAPLLKEFDGHVLVCCGDMPLMKRETYEALIQTHLAEGNLCTLLSGVAPQPLPYGRIVRDKGGNFARIVEDKDCTPAEKEIRELNAGVYVFAAQALLPALGQLRQDNAQGEYYLTDVPALLLSQGGRVGVCTSCTPEEMLGVNTLEQLKQVEETVLQRRREE
jgi:UDP-N-acetylglucosamine diphosphorylase/glucosamine-1-phosphate N-acetyltransferase